MSFSSQISWDLEALVKEVTYWLSGLNDTNTSKVGTLSSPRFLNLIRKSIGHRGSLNFQRMLYAESLAYIQPVSSNKHFLTVLELQQIGAICGQEVLSILDSRLRPQALAKSSKPDLEVLFLVIVGTILAASYTTPAIEYPLFPTTKVLPICSLREFADEGECRRK